LATPALYFLLKKIFRLNLYRFFIVDPYFALSIFMLRTLYRFKS